MDIDDAVRLLDAYLDAEWALTRAVYAEPDDEVVRARREEAEGFLRGSLGILAERMPNMPAAEVEAGSDLLSQYVRRKLFLVAEHRNPLWGELFGGVAGSTSSYAAGSYERLFYVATTEDGPRIVSHYDVDPLAPPVTWLHTGGVVLDQPGPVVGVRAIAEPKLSKHREHWAAMTEAAR